MGKQKVLVLDVLLPAKQGSRPCQLLRYSCFPASLEAGHQAHKRLGKNLPKGFRMSELLMRKYGTINNLIETIKITQN